MPDSSLTIAERPGPPVHAHTNPAAVGTTKPDGRAATGGLGAGSGRRLCGKFVNVGTSWSVHKLRGLSGVGGAKCSGFSSRSGVAGQRGRRASGKGRSLCRDGAGYGWRCFERSTLLRPRKRPSIAIPPNAKSSPEAGSGTVIANNTPVPALPPLGVMP